MILPVRSVLRDALSLLSARLVLAQLGLAIVVFLLSCFWLHIPDGSILDLSATVVLAVLIIALAGAGESALLLHLAGEPRSRAQLARGTLFFVIAVVFYFGWSTLTDHLRGNDGLWAGYWNSKAPRALHGLFSYEHIESGLEICWSSLAWIGAGAIAGALLVAVPARHTGKAVGYIFRSASFWLLMLAGAPFTVWIANILVAWVPGKALSVEAVSLVLRLLIAALVTSSVTCLWLAVIAVCARRTNLLYDANEGTPPASQPRTVKSP